MRSQEEKTHSDTMLEILVCKMKMKKNPSDKRYQKKTFILSDDASTKQGIYKYIYIADIQDSL